MWAGGSAKRCLPSTRHPWNWSLRRHGSEFRCALSFGFEVYMPCLCLTKKRYGGMAYARAHHNIK